MCVWPLAGLIIGHIPRWHHIPSASGNHGDETRNKGTAGRMEGCVEEREPNFKCHMSRQSQSIGLDLIPTIL